MTTIYKCDKCGAEFRNPKECRICEASHMSPVDRIKYMIMLECKEVCIATIHIMFMGVKEIASIQIVLMIIIIKILCLLNHFTIKGLVAYETF